jgi:hypothetical protein
MPGLVRRSLALLSLLSLPIALVAFSGGAASARVAKTTSTVTSTSLGTASPTFAGPAATGCATARCSLLTGPFPTPSTAGLSASPPAAAAAKNAATARQLAAAAMGSGAHVMPSPAARRVGVSAGADPPVPAPTVSCEPLGPGCDPVSMSGGGSVGVKGLNAVDSGTLPTNPLGDVEPADQGLCAGNGFVVEANNIGEVLVFNQSLHRLSSPIPLDTLMGLTGRGWSSGGDPSCLYDYANGGHWFFTEIASANTEASGGPFTGCFSGAKASTCYEAIAVTVGSNPFGPYNVYFLNANYNKKEPGYPYLLNDFAKIATTRDAFLLFYDEFPLNLAKDPGIGGGFFNGAQELAFDKNALEEGLPVGHSDGTPNQNFNVAIENMGLLPTPDGTCASDNQFHAAGIACWFTVIPAQAPDPSQYDNSYGGSGFMLASTNFNGFAGGIPSAGASQIAVFDWTGLRGLNSPSCNSCSSINFGGQLFSGVQLYNDPSNALGVGVLGAQKAGPIPLGNECGAAQNPPTTTPPGGCPEGGLNTNDDGFFQASQAQGQLWGAVDTAINQTYSSEATPEQHAGAAYWVVGTRSFDNSGVFSLTSQGYVSVRHEDLEFPAMAAEGFPGQDGGNGGAIMTFTLSGNGGPTGADNGGFYPSTAFGELSSTSGGLLGSVHVADLGQSPQDGFTEYQQLVPGQTRPRWGDYSWAIFAPFTGGKIDFATNYIQYPNCTGPAFTLKLATCGGTRDGFANWGTSVNYVVP